MSSIAFPPDETTGSRFAPHHPTNNAPPTADELRSARNRRNAQRSTGPRSPAGKARSAQNARTHGLSADPATLPPDVANDPTFREAKQELVDELRPTSPMQVFLVSQLAHLTWKIDQIPHLERHLLAATPADPEAPRNPEPGTPNASPADEANRLTALHLLRNEPTPLTRLWDHHRRLLTRAQSVLRQILHLQKHHAARAEEDAALEARLDRNQRAEQANAAERAAFDAMLHDMHADNQRKAVPAPSQGAPTCSNPHPANAPAQNEPTPPPPPLCLRASVAHSPTAPAQNEPTRDNGPRTNDEGPRTTHTPRNLPFPYSQAKIPHTFVPDPPRTR